ncbi:MULTISPECIES: type I-D CRISPR-associated helicase Cas3' [Nostoc]|uniref:Type I-D CRISPR-associated helicase Cas3 n=1 Tax=Nostoc paludosum FACHB-159 TaxID=2692908 RepID=A0ABR8KD01_9NOSO|nr:MULTISPECIES: type I-D CRISPR-associated helicase Cas3' [Nostoc]MBD2680945.1 type I-D CRISPR-associated helicase Cas3' [Nostoc sp. FACHB-857]MBD2737421.1 type I-D CRISPR-associated helicase Cas3' [Nostoc paludosum FACHB-159]
MKLSLQPLYSQLNSGVENCPLGCKSQCLVTQRASDLRPPEGCVCPLSSHQANTYHEIIHGDANIICNQAATGDGKTLGANLPSLINPEFRIMGLYPTIELVEDQAQQQYKYHALFGLDAAQRVDRLFGAELSRRVKQAIKSNKFQELLLAIEQKPILLTNPDIFHYITHFQYRDPAYGSDQLPLVLAEWPDLWVFDEFHIFGSHQETAALNSLAFIRRSQENQLRPRRFLFTSATPKPDFIQQLRTAGFKVAEVKGVYASEAKPGFRQILQAVELEFVELAKDADTQTWLKEMIPTIGQILNAESCARGLIIVNSVAKAGQVTRLLDALLPGVIVREISGRIDRRQRLQVQSDLQNAQQPVLVVGTSAVDVGVDFKIHLLIFESSDSATVTQRLGRLGRHSGFNTYTAFILIPGHTPWVMARLQEKLSSHQQVTREILADAILYAFNPPKEFEEYRQRWGALQAQGMFWRMTQENANVSVIVRAKMTEDLQRIYSQSIESKQAYWYKKQKTDVEKATQKELLSFRGGSTLQAAVWDENNFYTYDLLRLLPHARVEIIDRETFLDAANNSGRGEEEFPDDFINVYLRIQSWVEQRIEHLSLHTNHLSSELPIGELYLLDKLTLIGHPQADVINCLRQKKLLTFLVPVNKNKQSSHWEVSRTLNLSPLFGLYRLVDASEQTYACAFNQDALLLEALKWRLKKFSTNRFESSIF